MSAATASATLAPAPDPVASPVGRRAGAVNVPLLALAGLGLFGALRWGALLQPAPVGRMLGLVGLSTAAAGLLHALGTRWRRTAILPALLTLPAAVVISGIPAAWVFHLRVSVSARAIGDGLGALPAALIPYEQTDSWVRVVIVLGAAVLLLCAALIFAFAPATGRWRAASALPLLVLVSVPSILIRPGLPYLQGVILLSLLAALTWGDRLSRTRAPAAVALIVGAGVISMALAPPLDRHRGWIDVRTLAGSLAPRAPESFSFDQRYGPLHWPRSGREVLDVHAARADYWKVEDLALFDGRGFIAAAVPPVALPPPDPSLRPRFTQTIGVTIRALQSSQVIAAGAASAPQHLSGSVDPGLDPGTWTTRRPLRPGDSYTISTYSPRPSVAELTGAGTVYPQSALAAYRTLLLPSDQGLTGLIAPPFHTGLDPALLGGSYGRAYGLARRLAAGAATPYGFVQRVLALLGNGYIYDENPPAAHLPLQSFLFSTRRGYCQQFSGAMALLLRLGGLPARVAGGFTTGVRGRAGGPWIVSDLNAHDWVEVWFPRFGWVRFDPTPAVAPARAGTELAGPLPHSGGAATLILPHRHRDLVAVPPPAHRSLAPAVKDLGWSSTPWPLALAAVGLAFMGLAAALRAPPAGEELVRELERALRRSRRPAAPGETLAEIEHRLRHDERAAAYVRAIRLERYGRGRDRISSRDRRGLRAQLRHGLGPAGWMLALWALPPRRMR